MDELDAYCKLHFRDEEKMLEEIDYPEIDNHKAQHALFVTHLDSFLGKYEEQNITRNVDEFLFLKGWFMEHIAGFDRQYANLRKQGEGKA